MGSIVTVILTWFGKEQQRKSVNLVATLELGSSATIGLMTLNTFLPVYSNLSKGSGFAQLILLLTFLKFEGNLKTIFESILANQP